MVNCAVCKRNKDKAPKGITFHRFPKDVELCKKWIQTLNKQGWLPKDHDRICSDHFQKSDFDRTGYIVRLLKEAIPLENNQTVNPLAIDEGKDNLYESSRRSVTDVNPLAFDQGRKHLCESTGQFITNVIVTSEGTSTESTTHLSTEVCGNVLIQDKALTRRFAAHDHSYQVIDSPRKLKRKVLTLQEEKASIIKKLKLANRQIQRLKKTVISLKQINQRLKKKSLITGKVCNGLDNI